MPPVAILSSSGLSTVMKAPIRSRYVPLSRTGAASRAGRRAPPRRRRRRTGCRCVRPNARRIQRADIGEQDREAAGVVADARRVQLGAFAPHPHVGAGREHRVEMGGDDEQAAVAGAAPHAHDVAALVAARHLSSHALVASRDRPPRAPPRRTAATGSRSGVMMSSTVRSCSASSVSQRGAVGRTRHEPRHVVALFRRLLRPVHRRRPPLSARCIAGQIARRKRRG